ncbi:Hsp20/alpha crystallin family protein [Sinomonas sp. ASV322]|uniref:Hsp20/alpha crystallin family protein n=1 Tax=Sinomonas sp. ASV322 TaxID=3041920 RepID=UPI0027DAD3C0|nr:Hsp20/alpha crystallin family protein [Sinomonas sp. ASV322]MDQ4503026.1 Hsp20/alpha crystallin family protein [Sinomonas sp. ASV322]
MSDMTKWFEGRRTPFDLIERLFEGDVASGAIKVEQVIDGDALVVRAELPGIDPEKDVDVSVSGGELRINAHREEKIEYKERGSYRSEFRYGSLSRTLPLPKGAKEGDVTASYKDGVLEVRVPIPVQPAGAGTKIEVKRG